MYDFYHVLDASAFINGFELTDSNNFTVPAITEEVKDLKSRLVLNQAIEDERIMIQVPKEEFIQKLDEIIAESGDDLRLSGPDKMLLALALDLIDSGYNVRVMTDDYSMQNVLKIINVPYSSIITDGIKRVYNWVKTCEGCKKDYPADYPYDCEICGSRIFKRRIKN